MYVNLNPLLTVTTPWWKMVCAGKDGVLFLILFFNTIKYSAWTSNWHMDTWSVVSSLLTLFLLLLPHFQQQPPRSVWWKWLKCHLSHSSNSFRLILIISWKKGGRVVGCVCYEEARKEKKKVLSTTIILLEGATSRLGFEAIYTDDSGNTAQIEFNSKLIHPHYFLIKKW